MLIKKEDNLKKLGIKKDQKCKEELSKKAWIFKMLL